MKQAGYVRALAGLLSDPIFDSEFEKIVPGKWKGEIAALRKDDAGKSAAKRAAGLNEEMDNSSRAVKMSSIFCSIHADKAKPEKVYLPLNELKLDEQSLFPAPDVNAPGNDVWQNFLKEAVKLGEVYRDADDISLPIFIEALMTLMQRFLWSKPCAYKSLADISLYDHARLTGALAALQSEEVLLVGGDISGIQDFIYTITAKGAAKSLRGRSFYLQLLTEAVLRFVLRELELPYTNVIYSGGGHFFLLAPASKVEKLEGAQKTITQTLLRHHGTSLYLALGYAKVPNEAFFGGKFPECWGEMHRALAHKKQKRYSELGANLYKQVFLPREFGGNPDDKCDVCGEDQRKARPWGDSDIQDKVCSLCYSFFNDLGRGLSNNKFIALKFGNSYHPPKDTARDILAEFGMDFEFLTSAPSAKDLGQAVIWAFSDFNPQSELPGLMGVPTWLRYAANRVTDLQFDELQKEVKGGFARLGVLRMDVDNLGEIFKHGLGNQATLSRLASLSFRISLFFEGWLKKLCEGEEYKNKQGEGLIYTVYAGGDDLFLIGPWDLIPPLAQNIVKDFARYTSPAGLHASAGMAFIDGKYPVYQAAEDAGDALDNAKDELVGGRNAFTFLGKSWKWDAFEELSNKQKRLSNLVKPQEGGKAAPQALLQVLQQLALQEDQHKKIKGIHVWGRWIWMGMYQLTRMSEQNKATSQQIKAIRDELQQGNYQEISQWGVAARWTQLKERKKFQKEDAK